MTRFKKHLVAKTISNILIQKGYITTAELADAYEDPISSRIKMSKRSARLFLKKLADKDLIVSVKVGNDWRWILNPKMSLKEVLSQLAKGLSGS